jgi:excisionase family DNA binding protein
MSFAVICNLTKLSFDNIRFSVYNICKTWRKDGAVMEYMSVLEAAKKWGISERRVQKLCEENRIPGVSKLGFMWLIPKTAKKPLDGRTKQAKVQINEQNFSNR